MPLLNHFILDPSTGDGENTMQASVADMDELDAPKTIWELSKVDLDGEKKNIKVNSTRTAGKFGTFPKMPNWQSTVNR